MKKVIAIFAIATLAACGGAATEAKKDTVATTTVDTTKAATMDTTAAAMDTTAKAK